jgi:hypothetical protein
LLLTFLYKFARHEWIGISAAWDECPSVERAVLSGRQDQPLPPCRGVLSHALFQEMFRDVRAGRSRVGALAQAHPSSSMRVRARCRERSCPLRPSSAR